MNEPREIFGMALGLPGTPWYVQELAFSEGEKLLTIRVGFARGAQFPHPVSGVPVTAYDTCVRKWRHLNFFQFACIVEAEVPRVGDGESNETKVTTVPVPWAKKGCGFTLFFESWLVELKRSDLTARQMDAITGEWDTRIMRVVVNRTEEALAKLDLSAVQMLCMDETNTAKGQHYVTVMSDPKAVAVNELDGSVSYRAKVIAVTEGRDSGSVTEGRKFLEEHGCPAEQIQVVIKDMSEALEKGTKENFPKARRVVDFFHVVALLGKAFTKIRRQESWEDPEFFKGSLWALRKNEKNLTEKEAAVRSRILSQSHLKTARAFRLVESFKGIFRLKNVDDLEDRLGCWYSWARRSRLPEIKAVALTIDKHWDELLEYATLRLSNGPAEALNNVIQAAKRKARGFSNARNLRAVIFLIAGNLKFDLPHVFPAFSLTHSQ